MLFLERAHERIVAVTATGVTTHGCNVGGTLRDSPSARSMITPVVRELLSYGLRYD